MSTTLFCFDTSAFIEAWVRWYSPESFPSLWEHFSNMADNGNLLSPEEVLHELKKKDDDLYAWAKARASKMFVPLDEELQLTVIEILKNHQRLLDTKKNRSGADPFVIGFAKITGRVVVSMEAASGKIEVPKIPDVCKAYGIRCITLPELIRELKLKF